MGADGGLINNTPELIWQGKSKRNSSVIWEVVHDNTSKNLCDQNIWKIWENDDEHVSRNH